MTYLNQIIALHSSCKHGSESTRTRAMRQDLLANLDDSIRDIVAAYDEEGTWLGLVNHFLQTCGPPDIRMAVYAMLREAQSEEPARNLQQRVHSTVVAWQRAQSIYYGVHPEVDCHGATCLGHVGARVRPSLLRQKPRFSIRSSATRTTTHHGPD